MKIRLILSNFYPEEIALTNRMSSLIPELACRYEVAVVFLLQPGRDFDASATRQAFPGNSVSFYPVRAFPYNKSQLIQRTACELLNNLRLLLTARRVHADLTWVSIPQLMLLPVSAAFMPFCSGIRIVEIRDLTWQSVTIRKNTIAAIVRHCLDAIAGVCMRRFDAIITCTSAQAKRIGRTVRKPIHVLENGLSAKRFADLATLPSPGDIPMPFTLTYIGNVGFAQNLHILAKAAYHLRNDPSIRILLVGDGTELASIRRFVLQHRLENIEVPGRASWSQMLAYYSRSHALFANLRSEAGLDEALPSKLFEYLASGRPVIFNGAGYARFFLRHFSNVYYLASDDPEALVRTIKNVRHTANSAATLNRSIISERYIREQIFSRFLDSPSFCRISNAQLPLQRTV